MSGALIRKRRTSSETGNSPSVASICHDAQACDVAERAVGTLQLAEVGLMSIAPLHGPP